MVIPGTVGKDLLESYLASIVESSEDAVMGLDPNGVVLSWNPAAEHLLGHPASEILNRAVRPLIPAPFYDEESTILERILRGERVESYETLRQHRNGKMLEVSITASPIRDSNAVIIGVSHSIRGVVDRTRLEWAFQEKQKVQSDLEASEIRYRRLFEAAKDGILLLDAETGTIFDANPFLEELLGLSRKDLVGKPLWELGPLKDLIANQAAFQVLKDKGYIRYEHLPLETAKGKEVHVEFVSNVYVSAGERVIQCNIRDITLRYRAEQALRKAEEQLRHSQKMEAFGRLAAGVAHDFNNLLTVINGYAEIMAGTLDKNSPLQGDIEEIAKAGQRASLLTRQLLAFSRKQVLKVQVLNLNQVATDMQKMLKRLIGEDIVVVSTLAPDLGLIRIDPGQVEQVILNLSLNARDAMPLGGRLSIETGNIDLDEAFVARHPSLHPGPHIVLTVQDTGCGMSREIQDRLFEPFFTTKATGKGTGLGLATVLGIVLQSEGAIQVESEPGKGATFKIYLPRVAGTADGSKATDLRNNSPKGTETVLLVEDEPLLRKLARQILEMYGYSVLEASCGAEALKISDAHSGPIALLLSDMVMPGMSGRELSVALTGRRPGLKSLLVSGYSNDSVALHGDLNSGAAFLQKPYSPSDLALRVRSLLDGKPVAAEIETSSEKK